MICTGATLSAVAVVMAVAGAGRSLATDQGAVPSASIANTVAPDPLMRVNATPLADDRKPIDSPISGWRSITTFSKSFEASDAKASHSRKAFNGSTRGMGCDDERVEASHEYASAVGTPNGMVASTTGRSGSGGSGRIRSPRPQARASGERSVKNGTSAP